MTNAADVDPKLVTAPPTTASEPVSAVRFPTHITADIDAWGEMRGISRSEAIRRLVELGLKAAKK